MELWQFKVERVFYKSNPLLRFSHRNNLSIFNDKPFKDVDVGGRFNDDTLASAKLFIGSLGFQFPLPFNVKAAFAIFSLKDFPTFQEWEPLAQEYYDIKLYHQDLRLWWCNYFAPKTSADLYRWLFNAFLEAKSKLTISDQAAYSRSILNQFYQDKNRLDSFYGISPLPDSVKALLPKIKQLGSSFIPENSRSAAKKRKMEKAASNFLQKDIDAQKLL